MKKRSVMESDVQLMMQATVIFNNSCDIWDVDPMCVYFLFSQEAINISFIHCWLSQQATNIPTTSARPSSNAWLKPLTAGINRLLNLYVPDMMIIFSIVSERLWCVSDGHQVAATCISYTSEWILWSRYVCTFLVEPCYRSSVSKDNTIIRHYTITYSTVYMPQVRTNLQETVKCDTMFLHTILHNTAVSSGWCYAICIVRISSKSSILIPWILFY